LSDTYWKSREPLGPDSKSFKNQYWGSAMINFLKEFFQFLRSRKKLWLTPIILVMILIGGLLILAKGSVVAPFIYTLF
jgi:hypothetical protein